MIFRNKSDHKNVQQRHLSSAVLLPTCGLVVGWVTYRCTYVDCGIYLPCHFSSHWYVVCPYRRKICGAIFSEWPGGGLGAWRVDVRLYVAPSICVGIFSKWQGIGMLTYGSTSGVSAISICGAIFSGLGGEIGDVIMYVCMWRHFQWVALWWASWRHPCMWRHLSAMPVSSSYLGSGVGEVWMYACMWRHLSVMHVSASGAGGGLGEVKYGCAPVGGTMYLRCLFQWVAREVGWVKYGCAPVGGTFYLWCMFQQVVREVGRVTYWFTPIGGAIYIRYMFQWGWLGEVWMYACRWRHLSAIPVSASGAGGGLGEVWMYACMWRHLSAMPVSASGVGDGLDAKWSMDVRQYLINIAVMLCAACAQSEGAHACWLAQSPGDKLHKSQGLKMSHRLDSMEW